MTTSDEWVQRQIDNAPRLTPAQVEQVARLLAHAQTNREPPLRP